MSEKKKEKKLVVVNGKVVDPILRRAIELEKMDLLKEPAEMPEPLVSADLYDVT